MLPLLSALVDRIELTITSGAVIELVGLYLGLTALGLGIQDLMFRAGHGDVLNRIPYGRYTVAVLTRRLPSAIMLRAHPAVRTDRLRWSTFDATAATAPLQYVLLQVLPALEEEGLFRGVPLAIAVLLDVVAWPAVGVGTVVGVFVKSGGRGIALGLSVGWLLAALWLAGHWYLAIGLQVGLRLAAAVLDIGQHYYHTEFRTTAT